MIIRLSLLSRIQTGYFLIYFKIQFYWPTQNSQVFCFRNNIAKQSFLFLVNKDLSKLTCKHKKGKNYHHETTSD